ncbi:MAG: thiamine diphosphokinase [Desulfitobacteriaceae bacterium]|nr:thiamine diphosphokinase [Desulfitobacteriaceae bacterium]MDD4346308.1 thiamine diphosphokinase [Desulfitobacteriaceae bacterium]MDD4400546.1 thiamine diphosphokinase [Desulfitobacteriaceae bacterium]
MKVAMLVNGTWDSEWGKQELGDVEFLVCADGGANLALLSGRLPDVLIGDLDSITPANLVKCIKGGTKIVRYPKEKDQTDLELALDYACFQAPAEFRNGKIWLYGATGGRIDHLLGNIALLLAYARRGWRIILKDPEHVIWIIQKQEIIIGDKGHQISFLSLTEKAVVTTEGFYYPLKFENLFQDSTRGISNIFLGRQGYVRVDEGWVLAVMSNS